MRASRSFVLLSVCAVNFAFADTPDPAPAPDGGNAAHAVFPTDVFNRVLPRWLRFGGEFRSRLESMDAIKYTKARDLYLLTRLRVNITIQPTKWLTLFGETQDARAFFDHQIPNVLPYQNIWDIRQAYVQLGSSKEGWVDVLAGRQNLTFGDERVIGPSDWLNMGRTFDVVRLDLHHPGYQVSIFASSVIVGRDGVVDHHIQGNNLYGIYASFKNAVPKATLEPYVLWRVAPATAGLKETVGKNHMSEVTPGVRLAGLLPDGFDYNVEMDLQTGSLGAKTIRSFAGYWSLGRTFQSVRTTPRLSIESNYATGTKNPKGTTWNTFDQIYPSSHDKLDFADQVGRKNIVQFRVGMEEKASRRWKLRQTYENFWLTTQNDALYGTSGAISVAADPASPSRHVGQEIDMIGEYKLESYLLGGLGYGRFFTGKFLRSASQGHDFNYPFMYITYRF